MTKKHAESASRQRVEPNGLSNPYLLDESISNFLVVMWYFSMLFKFSWNILLTNSGDPDHTWHSAVFDQDLH